LSVAPLVSPRFSRCFLISSTESNLTDQSTQMKLSHTVLQSRLLFSMVKAQKLLRTYFFLTSFPSPKVSKLQVVS
jgi:hypothetical protein